MPATAVMLAAACVAAAVMLWPAGWRRDVLVRLATPEQGGSGGGSGRVSHPATMRSRLHQVVTWWRSKRGTQVRPAAVVAGLEGLAAGLRAGLPAGEALIVAIDTAPDEVASAWRPIAVAASEGRPLAPEWRRCAAEHPASGMHLVAAFWEVSEELGCPLADGVETVARAVRAEEELARRVRTATAGPRATSLVLSLLPVGGGLLLVAMGYDPLALWFGTPIAVLVTLMGVTLLLLGRVVTARMVAACTR